jgi:hypothetical protein
MDLLPAQTPLNSYSGMILLLNRKIDLQPDDE